MKKLLLLVGVVALGFAALCHANITTLSSPGVAGRPASDTVTNLRTESAYLTREDLDTSNFYQATVTSPTTTPINVTSVAGLCYCGGTTGTGKSYAGPYKVNVVNTGKSTLVVFMDTTSTAITTSMTAGTVILTGASATIPVGNYDGITVHLIGLTATTTVNYSVTTK